MIDSFFLGFKTRLINPLLLIALSFSSVAYGAVLDCQIPKLEKISISMKGKILVVKHHQNATSWRPESEFTEREVIFHHYSEPIDPKTKLTWEPPHSLILLKSITKESVEFAPDLLFVNWGKGTLKTISTYEDKAETRWTCLRKD